MKTVLLPCQSPDNLPGDKMAEIFLHCGQLMGEVLKYTSFEYDTCSQHPNLKPEYAKFIEAIGIIRSSLGK